MRLIRGRESAELRAADQLEFGMRERAGRSRCRDAAKWTFTALAVLIAAAAIGTLFGHVVWLSPSDRYECVVGAGALTLQAEWLPINSGPLGFWIGPNSPGLRWQWSFEFARDRIGWRAVVPLWAPFLLSAFGAGLLWRAEVCARRRAGAGHCTSCGYDLAGNATGVCPECGSPIVASARST